VSTAHGRGGGGGLILQLASSTESDQTIVSRSLLVKRETADIVPVRCVGQRVSVLLTFFSISLLAVDLWWSLCFLIRRPPVTHALILGRGWTCMRTSILSHFLDTRDADWALFGLLLASILAIAMSHRPRIAEIRLPRRRSGFGCAERKKADPAAFLKLSRE